MPKSKIQILLSVGILIGEFLIGCYGAFVTFPAGLPLKNEYGHISKVSKYNMGEHRSRTSWPLFVSTGKPANKSNEMSSKRKQPVLLQTVIKDVPLASILHFIKNEFKLSSSMNLPLPFSKRREEIFASTKSVLEWECDIAMNHILSVEVVGIQKKKDDVINMAMVAVKRIANDANVDSVTQNLLEGSEKQLVRAFERELEKINQYMKQPIVSDAEVISKEQLNTPTKTNSLESKDACNVDTTVNIKSAVEDKVFDEDGVIDVPSHPNKAATESDASDEIIEPPPINLDDMDESIKNDLFEYSSKGLNIVVGNDESSRSATDLNDLLRKDIKNLSKKEKQLFEDEFKSPEDFAKQILDFANNEAQKDKDGSGFADGVFKAARDIVKEKSVGVFENDFEQKSAEEEELRRLFEAGRDMVEGKMTKAAKEGTNDILYSVEDQPKPVEKDLAQLEVQILRNSWDEPIDPSERLDLFAPPPSFEGKLFDASSVNYPGAIPGSKHVNMHDDLKQFVDYANFAAKTIMSLEEEIDTETGGVKYYRNGIEMPISDVSKMQKTVNDAARIGIIDDPREILAEKGRLQMLVEEVSRIPDDRFSEIVDEYRDLLLSDRFVLLVKDRFATMVHHDRKCESGEVEKSAEMDVKHEKERIILGKLVQQAMVLLKEVQALGAELEVMQLEIVRSICQVAMDPKHKTEEEAAFALTDAVRDMLPLLDEVFVSYLKYAVAEEEARLARRGLVEDPDHNRWLCVLKIVQNGVYAELGRKVGRHVEIVLYCMRMKTREQRRALLQMNVDNMATMDIRPFRKVVDNIVDSLGSAAKGEFDDGISLGEWTKRIIQLAEDIEIVLPPEKVDVLARDADKWLEKQKDRVMEQRKKSVRLIESRKKGQEVKRKYLASGIGLGEEDRMP